MTEKTEKQALYRALKRKALGETVTETQEEYGLEEGEAVLKKRKVTTKEIPPDLTAVKILLEGNTESLSDLTDAELYALKEKLEAELKLNEKGEK